MEKIPPSQAGPGGNLSFHLIRRVVSPDHLYVPLLSMKRTSFIIARELGKEGSRVRVRRVGSGLKWVVRG